MPVNVALGHVSNAFLIAALVIYSLSVVAFAGDFAYGRPRRAATARGQQAQDRAAALAAVGPPGRAAQAPAVPEPPGVPEPASGPAASHSRPDPAVPAP